MTNTNGSGYVAGGNENKRVKIHHAGTYVSLNEEDQNNNFIIQKTIQTLQDITCKLQIYPETSAIVSQSDVSSKVKFLCDQILETKDSTTVEQIVSSSIGLKKECDKTSLKGISTIISEHFTRVGSSLLDSIFYTNTLPDDAKKSFEVAVLLKSIIGDALLEMLLSRMTTNQVLLSETCFHHYYLFKLLDVLLLDCTNTVAIAPLFRQLLERCQKSGTKYALYTQYMLMLLNREDKR